MFDLTQRVPVRLVQENGNRIDLDVHTMDINIHRSFSAFPVPFMGGYNAGVDLNLSQVEIELQGVFADEPGQVAGAKATALIDLSGDTPPFSPPDSGSGQGDGPTVFPPTSNASSSGFRIGGAAFNPWGAGPILPTSPPVSDADEGQANYLGRLHNRYFDLPVAYQMSESPNPAPPAGNCVRFVFDAKRSGSVKEPFAYPLMVTRNTDLTAASSSSITANSNGTLTITVASGDPRTWLESHDGTDTDAWIIGAGSKVLGRFRSATSTTIVFQPFPSISTSTSSQTNSQTIKLLNFNVNSPFYSRSTDRPVVMIPIKHMFDENPPNFANGSSRSVGTATLPSEVLAYLISQAITSTTATTVGGITDRAYNSDGGKDLSDVFTTTVTENNYGVNVKINIEQKFAFDLEDDGGIPTNIPANIRPTIQGFTGGITGNKVKSAGDKVQDILGIVTNSQNYTTNNPPTGITGVLEDTLSFLSKLIVDRPEDIENVGDYIVGIQLPYDTTATRGKSTLDTEIAQRNHFTTFGEQTQMNKLAIKNHTHASLPFNSSAQNSLRNGIRAMVTDFIVMHDAQERLYNFVLKLIAVDTLLA